MSQVSLHSTVQHCWRALFDQSLEDCDDAYVQCQRHTRPKELPSTSAPGLSSYTALRAQYSLFRAEEVCSRTGVYLRGVHATNTVFEALDPKDALLRIMTAAGCEDVMPTTLLLNYDCFDTTVSEQAVSALLAQVQEFVVKHALEGRVLLKAALGAGGHGLYFVHSAHDIQAVICNQLAQARSKDGFLPQLLREYGEVPQWSLQALVDPVRVQVEYMEGYSGARKSQVRAHACYVNGRIYLYDMYEVRLPIWKESTEADGAEAVEPAKVMETTESTFSFEQRMVGSSAAVPYNRDRSKPDTMRLCLSECPELAGANDCITSTCQRILSALDGQIKSGQLPADRVPVAEGDSLSKTLASLETAKLHRMAIIGIDLLITPNSSGTDSDDDFKVYLLEINCNPALPQPEKHRMSPNYHKHVKGLCRDLMRLGLSGGIERDNFGFTDCSVVS